MALCQEYSDKMTLPNEVRRVYLFVMESDQQIHARALEHRDVTGGQPD